jgi:hypothetical protein
MYTKRGDKLSLLSQPDIAQNLTVGQYRVAIFWEIFIFAPSITYFINFYSNISRDKDGIFVIAHEDD